MSVGRANNNIDINRLVLSKLLFVMMGNKPSFGPQSSAGRPTSLLALLSFLACVPFLLFSRKRKEKKLIHSQQQWKRNKNLCEKCFCQRRCTQGVKGGGGSEKKKVAHRPKEKKCHFCASAMTRNRKCLKTAHFTSHPIISALLPFFFKPQKLF